MTEIPSHRDVLGIPGRHGIELALAFTKIAKKDLKASEMLYEGKLYPQAVFELSKPWRRG